MKKGSTVKQVLKQGKRSRGQLTVGLDLGDRNSRYCVLDEHGQVTLEGRVATTQKAFQEIFGAMLRSRIALETGTHSPWVSRYLEELGHEVIVANARRVRLITESSRKDDRMDAKALARLARIDPELLSPVRHRSKEAQRDLMMIRARAVLVGARTMLINAARGITKSYGERMRKCGGHQMGEELAASLSPALQSALQPLLAEIESLTRRIKEYNRRIEQLAKERYPEVERLTQVKGVGALIALTYILTVEDPHRFRRSRDAGAFVGLRPKRRDSGSSSPQLRISKEGDSYLRKMMVQGAQFILGPFGMDSDLRRWGLGLAQHGGKNAKKRAVVAVARKLAVLLHKLWVSGEVYVPLRSQDRKVTAA
jgi:transposase